LYPLEAFRVSIERELFSKSETFVVSMVGISVGCLGGVEVASGVGETVEVIEGIAACVSTVAVLTVDKVVCTATVGLAGVGVGAKPLQDANITAARKSIVVDLLIEFMLRSIVIQRLC
jgi:hypothetical protein